MTNKYFSLAIFILLLFSACSTPPKPVDNSDDAPTSTMRLEEAKDLLKDADTPELINSEKVHDAKHELEQIKSDDPEYIEAKAILKSLDDHENARLNPVFWDTLMQIDDRRKTFADQLKNQIRSIDPKIDCLATGFANTELSIRSPKLTEAQVARIQSILGEVAIPERIGFIKLVFRNDEKILSSKVLQN